MIIKKTCANDSFIEQLLNGWIQANQRYVDLLGKKDCCWWYNERTNVSVLAGAAWSLGWAAIEEYPSDKLMKGYFQEGTDTSRGRVDLYITSNHDDIAVEAKHAWYNLDNIVVGDKTIRCKMNKASDDAKCLKEQANRHFSATFVVFYTERNSQELIAEENIEKLINNAISNSKRENISYAYIIDPQFMFQNMKEYYYPSVALILEKVKG
ncbi:hypothetical protein LES60_21610 [Pectobacterium brasiliense]|uniref:hypothetical protein n=1 Tax=Pectobacterium TaxID=122277 RepID=UPI0015F551E2|nr:MULTISPECIES: hypothetical protein [Pectobacterium]MBA5600984.1 hypothetical protein [Pectobacterium aroidearum]MCA5921937.1 hypothetical protein [Pectobacterium brasiliense]MCA5929254.1 hypothetical protein [Pectobacterium brasiliense]MCA5937929.1 hypothetical protein [Pectobacterium brasiliense]MCA5942211.1 hypothetical protein [Pectobacterium brasiliense]